MLNSSLTDDQRTLLDAVHRYDACCLRVLDLGLDLSPIRHRRFGRDRRRRPWRTGRRAPGGSLQVTLRWLSWFDLMIAHLVRRPFKRPAFDLTIVSLHRRPSSYPYW